jgi:hypothetical protein
MKGPLPDPDRRRQLKKPFQAGNETVPEMGHINRIALVRVMGQIIQTVAALQLREVFQLALKLFRVIKGDFGKRVSEPAQLMNLLQGMGPASNDRHVFIPFPTPSGWTKPTRKIN